MKGIWQGTEHHNLFSKEMRLSPKRQDRLPMRWVGSSQRKGCREAHPSTGRFITIRENDAGRFRECSSRNIVFSFKG